MRRKIKPRTDIPNWRDPDMPVLMAIRQDNGTTKLEPFSSNEVQRYMQIMLDNCLEPHASCDPTYNLRKPRR